MKKVLVGVIARLFSGFIGVVALGLVSGCDSSDPLDNLPSPKVRDLISISSDPVLLRSYLSGNTLWSYTDARRGGHGTQVELHTKGGRTVLWYPGNERPVTGKWEVRSDDDGAAILCYKYQPNSYNPVTGTVGGEWECRKPGWVFLGTALRGDPFGLGAGRLPFVIPDRNHYAPKRLMVMAGKDPERLRAIETAAELR